MAVVHFKLDRTGEPLCAHILDKAEEGAGTTLRRRVTCDPCLVASDKLMEEGDLVTEGDSLESLQFKLDPRPPEYRSVGSFADFLADDERQTAWLDEVQELVVHADIKMSDAREQLRQRGITVARRPEAKRVRGINSYWK